MPKISDKSHIEKLNECGINIKTKYIVGDKILERNTDNSVNDDISKGIRCEKKYFIGNRLVHTEKLFDSRIEYTFISKEAEDKEYTCPNCGMHSKLKNFIDGCPYCRTYYNLDYTDKDLGSKYYYDRVLRSNTYRVVTLIVDIIISLILSFAFNIFTSRTFNSYDLSKSIIYGFILAAILFYFFYILDAYLVLGPIKRYKDKQNQKQMDFWARNKFSKKNFFNNLNYEVRNYYYSEDNIIDYDVLDYVYFNDYENENGTFVEVMAEVRLVYFINNKIKSRIVKDLYVLKKNYDGVLEIKDGANIIKCHSCGASIDATKSECDYCHTKTKHLQEWILYNKD